jgi:hypothetical protein
MHEAQRYRYKAAECLRAAQQARDLFHRAAHLSMALSWLSLARQDEDSAPSNAHAGRGAGRHGGAPRRGSQTSGVPAH